VEQWLGVRLTVSVEQWPGVRLIKKCFMGNYICIRWLIN